MIKNIPKFPLIIIIIAAFLGGLALYKSYTNEPHVPDVPIKTNIIIYNAGGYTPKTTIVKKGTTVIFKNQGSGAMWTASDVHPTHTLYPTTGGCGGGSTFDSCLGIASGQDWTFKFDIVGTWNYHNHLNPLHTGTIIVQE